MKRVAFVFLSLILACYSLHAQYNVFYVGGRFGGNGYLSKTTDDYLKPKFGIQTMFDLNYSYLGDIDSYAYLGFKTGVSVGWSQNGFVSNYQNHFTNYDYLGKRMDYTITTDNVTQTISQLQVEVPIMLAFRYEGVCANLGVKGMFPFNATYKQRVNGLNISAYYPEYDVTVTNELITGRASEEQFSTADKMNVPTINIMAAVEFGYEFSFADDDHALGLMAYLDYCFWNNYSGQEGATAEMITVDPIRGSGDPIPNVNIGILSKSSVYAMNYFDIGVKLYYRFQADAIGGYSRYGGRVHHRYAHGRR